MELENPAYTFQSNVGVIDCEVISYANGSDVIDDSAPGVIPALSNVAIIASLVRTNTKHLHSVHFPLATRSICSCFDLSRACAMCFRIQKEEALRSGFLSQTGQRFMCAIPLCLPTGLRGGWLRSPTRAVAGNTLDSSVLQLIGL